MSVAGNDSGGRGPEIANWKWAGALWGGFYSKHHRQPAPDPDGSAFDVLSSESTTQPQQGPPRRPLFFAASLYAPRSRDTRVPGFPLVRTTRKMEFGENTMSTKTQPLTGQAPA